VNAYIEEALAKGAELIAGKDAGFTVPAQGYFVAPTVIGKVHPEARIAQEEVFGPVLSVISYTDEDEAVRIANGTPYGLAAAVWSSDRERALKVAKRLRAGQVDINGAPFNPAAPFGGFKMSGVGRENGIFGLEEFLEPRAIQLVA
jgi:acyl-CoA reductase-like NAD-dependent aldehyde dehydrogenase